MRLRTSLLAAKGLAALLIALGLLLRLAVALQGDPSAAYQGRGGDEAWYLAQGEGLLSGQLMGVSRGGIPFRNDAFNIPPLYVIFVGVWQQIASPEGAVIGIWVSQSLLSVLTGVLAADAARRLAQSTRVGLIVLAVMMLDPSQVLEPRLLLTETLYIALMTAGVWAYLVWMADVKAFKLRAGLGVGLLLGLASLTRAVGIAYPLIVCAHLVWRWRAERRRALAAAGLLLAAYLAITSTWTVYNWVAWDRFLYLSDQLFPALWRGATTQDGQPHENDALLLAAASPAPDCDGGCTPRVTLDLYAQQALRFITEDVAGYVRLRLTELGASILQPHAATTLPGESLRALAADWARGGFTGEGLIRLVNGDDFWLKLAIYAFKYVGYGLMLIGLWRLRSRFELAAVPLSFIGYTVAIHVVLLALPRYIFPIMPMVWMLAGAALRPLAHSRGASAPAVVPAQHA